MSRPATGGFSGRRLAGVLYAYADTLMRMPPARNMADGRKEKSIISSTQDATVEKAAAKRMESYSLPASTSKPFGELSPVLQQQIEDVFKRYDIDCDMSISIDELRTLMSDLGGAYIPKPVCFALALALV